MNLQLCKSFSGEVGSRVGSLKKPWSSLLPGVVGFGLLLWALSDSNINEC